MIRKGNNTIILITVVGCVFPSVSEYLDEMNIKCRTQASSKTKYTICNRQNLKFDFLGELWNLHVDKNIETYFLFKHSLKQPASSKHIRRAKGSGKCILFLPRKICSLICLMNASFCVRSIFPAVLHC